MYRLTLAVLVCVASLLAPLVSQATPVTITVDQWQSSDGGFSFSAIHSATSAGITLDGDTYWRSGSIDYQVNPAGLLTGAD